MHELSRQAMSLRGSTHAPKAAVDSHRRPCKVKKAILHVGSHSTDKRHQGDKIRLLPRLPFDDHNVKSVQPGRKCAGV